MEMKILILLAIAGLCSAQTIYKVTPGTKNNKIILTVENSSADIEMTNVMVRSARQLTTIDIKNPRREIEKIEKQSSKEVEFAFDVNRVAFVNKTDTLKFQINDKTGNWEKEILIGYELPAEYKLEQNYPNPFNPETLIGYQLPENGKITIKIYDVLGRDVFTLVNELQEAGYYEKKFNGQNLASGMYIYRLSSGEINLTKKMLLVK